MLGQRAGSTVSVNAQVQCQEPKIGQQKVQFYCEDEIHCRSLSMLHGIQFHSKIIKNVALIPTVNVWISLQSFLASEIGAWDNLFNNNT